MDHCDTPAAPDGFLLAPIVLFSCFEIVASIHFTLEASIARRVQPPPSEAKPLL